MTNKKFAKEYPETIEFLEFIKTHNPDPPLFRVWKTGADKSQDVNLKQLLKLLKFPWESLRIQALCNHPETWNDHEIKTCKRCREQLEVTSFRD